MPSAMAGIALAASCAVTQAQLLAPNIFFGPTGTEASVSNPDGTWGEGYGNCPGPAWDATTPPPTGDTQGSIKFAITIPSGGGQNFAGCWDNNNNWYGASGNNTIDGTKYASIEFDFKYDVTSTIVPAGDANIQIGLDTGYGGPRWSTYNPASIDPNTTTSYFDGNWHHISVAIPNIGGISAVAGPQIYTWVPGTDIGTINYWMANLEMKGKSGVIPPPTVSLKPVKSGLVQFADYGASYNRQDIATTTTGSANLTWYGQPKPVTYSFTIASWPAKDTGWQAGLHLCPDPQASQINSDPDWSDASDLWVAMQQNADGTVSAGIAYKTNQVNNNAQMFVSPGALVPYQNEALGLNVPSAVGTWTLTFTSDTAMTLTWSNGASTISTNATLPADVAAAYSGYVGAFLYSSPAANANVGDYSIFTAYNITGVGTPVHEDLTSGALSAPFLNLISQGYYNAGWITNPPNQIFVTSADAYWFTWTIPASGFSPIYRTNLVGGAWANLTPAAQILSGTTYWNLLSKASTSAHSQYYAMVFRVFSQLQVILPGETNAPGTLTGKTGTPTTLSAGGPPIETVTVNACDANWNVMTGITDMVNLTTTDTGASIPGDTAMVSGTVTFPPLLFSGQGTFTVTASDTTNTNILSNTSSPVTVGP